MLGPRLWPARARSAPPTPNGCAAIPTPPPTTLIALGITREQADAIFTGCRWAGHNGNSEGIATKRAQYHPDIFVCGPPRMPWQQLWKEHQDFG